MKEAELVQLNENENKNCTLYTIQFLGDDQNEYTKFFSRFEEDAHYNEDLMRIVGFIEKIADYGAVERFFRPEGKMSDRVCALPIEKSSLRLYCLRLSDSILILGNGGIKRTQTYNENEELHGYVMTLQKFDKLINEGVKNGTITITANTIETNQTFKL